MRTSIWLCSLVLTSLALGQGTGSSSGSNDLASAYGGVQVTAGSAGSVLPQTPGAPPPAGSAVCGSTDPCVLTGQYNRYRMSVNVNETTLANFNSPSTFGLANFYHVNSTPPGTFLYEPVVAQPLYVTNVPQAGGGN